MLREALDLADLFWKAGEKDLEELHDMVRQAFDDFKSRTMVASWQDSGNTPT